MTEPSQELMARLLRAAERAAELEPQAAARWLREERSAPFEARVALFSAVLRQRLEGELFWLFRPAPLTCVPSDGDRELALALELEARLRAFEQALQGGALDAATEAARRQLLQAELEEAGLFERPLLPERLYWLRTWGLGALASLSHSVQELWSYYGSPERRALVSAPPPERLLDGVLAVDWAVAVTALPPGPKRFRFWALAERTFRKLGPFEPGRGEIYLSEGALRVVLHYRLEDGTHTRLYDARLNPGGPSESAQ